jgi:hypothetical protein
MKTLTIIYLSILIGTPALHAVVALPPAGTNNFAAALQARQIIETAQRSFDTGQLAQLQQQVDMLQIEFLILAIAVGAAGAASVLTIHNLREAGRVRKDHAEESNTHK